MHFDEPEEWKGPEMNRSKRRITRRWQQQGPLNDILVDVISAAHYLASRECHRNTITQQRHTSGVLMP